MMTEPWRNLTVGVSPSVTRSSPPKRSFDVAFLTGIGDTPSPEDDSKDDVIPTLKVAKNYNDPPVVVNTSSPSPSATQDLSESLSKSSRSSYRREEKNYGSAFTKVFRPPIASSPPSSGSHFEAPSSLSSTWPPSTTPFTAMSTLLGGGKSFSPLMGGSSFLPQALAPLLSPTSSSSQESLNNNLVEEYLKSQQQIFSKNSPLRGDMTTTEALSRLRSSMVPPSDSYKLPFASLPYALSGKLPTPFLPQSSVSALIPPSLTNLTLPAQNVCAKCNISFRMTSDLVYHMRSQHKREPDLFRKRRNEKLKCPICGETFRERHHLTRHMTAHQDREEEVESK